MAGDGGSPKMFSKAMAIDTKLKGEGAHCAVILHYGKSYRGTNSRITQRLP